MTDGRCCTLASEADFRISSERWQAEEGGMRT